MIHQYRFIGQRSSDGAWVLDESEKHHLKKVLRLKSGTMVEVANGCGLIASGKIDIINNEVIFKEDHLQRSIPPKKKLAVAVSFQNKKYFSDIISPLVELGVDEVYFYSQKQTPKHFFEMKHQQKLIEASYGAFKQSKRTHFCKLHFVDDLVVLAKTFSTCFLFDHILGSGQKITELELSDRNLLIIGSELGHDESTQNALQKLPNVKSLKLLEETLRATTATISISSWFAFLRFASTI